MQITSFHAVAMMGAMGNSLGSSSQSCLPSADFVTFFDSLEPGHVNVSLGTHGGLFKDVDNTILHNDIQRLKSADVGRMLHLYGISEFFTTFPW